jgi:hypothetical protein
MVNFWLDDPRDIINISFDTKNGILNIASVIAIIALIVSGILNDKWGVNSSIICITLCIIAARCDTSSSEAFIDNFLNGDSSAPVAYNATACKNHEIIYNEGQNKDEQYTNNHEKDNFFRSGIRSIYDSQTKNIQWSVKKHGSPKDTKDFADWCYNDKNNCKSNSIYMYDPLMSNENVDCTPPVKPMPIGVVYQQLAINN